MEIYIYIGSATGVNFTNNLQAAFFTKVFCTVLLYLQFGFVSFWKKNIGAKATRKMLVQLTTGKHNCIQNNRQLPPCTSMSFFFSK